MATESAAIYVVAQGLNEPQGIRFAVERLAEAFDRILVVHEPAERGRFTRLLGDLQKVERLEFTGPTGTPLAGYKRGLTAVRAGGRDVQRLLLTGSHVFAPIGGDQHPPLRRSRLGGLRQGQVRVLDA